LRPGWAVVFALWNAVGALAQFRDLFLSPEWRARLDTYSPLSGWSWHVWALGAAAIVVAASLEGGYRVYRRLDGERVAQIDVLRAQLGAGAGAPPIVPGRAYVRETSGKPIVKRYAEARWNERDVIFDSVYRGRWITGRARINGILSKNDGGASVSLTDVGERQDTWGWLTVPKEERYRIEHMEPGDEIVFDAEITGISLGILDLKLGSITPSPRPAT
jgi:hypothetical protein